MMIVVECADLHLIVAELTVLLVLFLVHPKKRRRNGEGQVHRNTFPEEESGLHKTDGNAM